jgi:hypothetical protein
MRIAIRRDFKSIFPRLIPPRTSTATPESEVTHPQERSQRFSPKKSASGIVAAAVLADALEDAA